MLFISIAIVLLLNTTVSVGILDLTAVSKSKPIIPNAASPIKFTQNFSGSASLAPMISPSPVPNPWDLPQPI